MTANKLHLEILKAVVNYKKGSAALVRMFEKLAVRYYEEDRRDCTNLSFFLNALKEFPVLQRAAADSLRTFGRFKIDIKDGDVNLENNGKPKDNAPFQQAIVDYKAKEYTSLLSAHQQKILKAFDLDSRMKGFANSATAIVVNALAEEKATKDEVIARLLSAVEALRTTDFSEKVEARKAELAADAITGEQIAEAAANTETAEPAAEATPAATLNVA